jgi:hypothetical protein
MLLNYNDMKYAEAYGGVNLRPNRNGAGELHRLPDRRHF